MFEGRAPAFTKDPLQAVVLAPFFVFAEFIFSFGLFPNLAKKLETDINIKVAEFKKSNLKKRNWQFHFNIKQEHGRIPSSAADMFSVR